LRFVYLGNVPGHPAENTYCPRCEKLLIERRNYQILKYNLEGNRCSFCSQTIAGYFE
jgi:pyruvate formate lyase activating enzyme